MENRNAASRMIADYNAMIRYKLQEIDAEECSESICSMNEELKKVVFFVGLFTFFFLFLQLIKKFEV